MTQSCQMKVTSSDSGGGGRALCGLQRMPKAAIHLTFLIFFILWAAHYCSAAAVATETLVSTEPITTSNSLTEEMTTTTLAANDSAVQNNSSSSSSAAAPALSIQPVNQQLSLYAIDGDTLDRLFAQYISNVLSSKQLLHTSESSNFGGLVDIRKDQQLQQVMKGSSVASPNEKAVILLKGSNSQLVINGNLVQYIYNVDNAKCNLAHHHAASSSAQTEKPEVSSASPVKKETEAPSLAVIKSISQQLPVATLLTTTAAPIGTSASAESSNLISTQFTTFKPANLKSTSSSSPIASSPSTSNIFATQITTHLTTKRPFVDFPISVTENLSLAKSTTNNDDSSNNSSSRRSSSSPEQSVSTSTVWSSITSARRTTTSSRSTIRPRVSIVVTPMSTTRSSTLALAATTAQQQQQQQHQHDSLISLKSTSTAKSSFTASSSTVTTTTTARSRSRSTARPSFTTTTTSTAAPLTVQLTTMGSISPSNSSAPPFTLTFAPSPSPSSSSSITVASTRLSPSSSSFSSLRPSPASANIFPTLSTLTTSSSSSVTSALPSKSSLISKEPALISGNSSSSSLSTIASSHSLNSSSSIVKVTPISLATEKSTPAVNDLSANLGASSTVSGNSSSSSGAVNAAVELSTTASSSATWPATLPSTMTASANKRIVLSIHKKTASSMFTFTTSTTQPPQPSVTSESVLDNTIEVEVNNRSSSIASSATVKRWSTEKPKLTEEVMDQSDDKLQSVHSTTNTSIATTASTTTTTTATTTSKTGSLKTSLNAVKSSSSTRRPAPSQSSSSKTKVTRFPSPIVSWHRNQSSTPPSTLSVKQALKSTIRLRPPSTKKQQASTTTRFVPTRFIYPMAPTSPTSLASSTRARQPFDELYELRRRFIENKRNFFNRILATTTTRRPIIPSFAKWIIQGNFRYGRRR